jgi:ATP-binding cassette subfamily F protein 3
VFETIDEVAVGDARKNVRSLLGSFLFSGDDVDKKVKVLSGGEKGRLAMCKLLLQPYSLLVLDEPTNHLDMRSKEVLKSALMRYDGTLIVVSHDRDFLQGLTTKVFEFKGGSIKPHIGDVNDYLAMRKIESFKELEQKTKQTKVAAAAAPVAENKVNHEEQKQKEKEVRTLQNQVSKSEQEIARLEMEIKKVDDKLLDPEQYNVVVSDKEMFSRYEAMKKQLEAEMMKWEDLQGKAEALQKS